MRYFYIEYDHVVEGKEEREEEWLLVPAKTKADVIEAIKKSDKGVRVHCSSELSKKEYEIASECLANGERNYA